MKRFLVCLCLILLHFCFYSQPTIITKADDLSDNIIEQIETLDLDEIEKLFNENASQSFLENLKQVINGEYTNKFTDYINVILSLVKYSIKDNITFIVSFLAVILFIQVLKNYLKDNSEVNELISYICNIAVVVLLSLKILTTIKQSISTINTISKINDLVSPLLLTLMVASGGNISATIFSPTTVFLSTFINTICLKILLPIVLILIVFSLITTFNNGININGFNELLTSIFKWMIGIISIAFTLLLSVQGITAGIQDGITLKATKYALSSSIPIIGGIVKESFDFILASSIIVKNSIGLISIILSFSVVIKSVISLVLLSLVFKFISAILTQFGENKANSICLNMSKAITYLLALILICALLLIIYIFLMIITANAFI